MSYSILYRSMFVKVSDGLYIPMMEMGDNNVYECSYGRGKARRARSWSNINLNNGQKFFTKGQVLSCLDKWNNDVEEERNKYRNSDDEWCRNAAEKANFGFFDAIAVYGKGGTWGTTFKDVRNIIMGGFDNYITFNDAVTKCGLHISYWEKDNDESMFACQKTFYFKTEDEMFDFINTKFGDKKDYFFVYNSGSANSHYDMAKAVNSFPKLNGKKEKFKLACLCSDNVKRYLVIENGMVGLSDGIDGGSWFNKYKVGDIKISDIAFRIDGIYHVSYIYEHTISSKRA